MTEDDGPYSTMLMCGTRLSNEVKAQALRARCGTSKGYVQNLRQILLSNKRFPGQ